MGRPTSIERRNIAEEIIQAAQACLLTESPRKVSMKDVARRAGTNQAMVTYYFGSKDGLLIEIVGRQLNEIRHSGAEFLDALRRNEIADPTRATIRFILDAFDSRPVLRQILGSELPDRDSRVRSHFREHWSKTISTLIVAVVDHAVATGHYRHDIDSRHVVNAFRALVFFPMMTQSYQELVSIEPDFRADAAWVDYVCALLDNHLRNPASGP